MPLAPTLPPAAPAPLPTPPLPPPATEPARPAPGSATVSRQNSNTSSDTGSVAMRDHANQKPALANRESSNGRMWSFSLSSQTGLLTVTGFIFSHFISAQFVLNQAD